MVKNRLKRFLAVSLLIAAAAAALLGLAGCGPSAAPAPSPSPSAVSPIPSASPSPGTGEEAAFAVHFIDVGQADAILVICDDKTMLIDGGNVADSSTIVTYLKKLDISYLDYVVCTHAHEDHVGGLAGALNQAKAGTVYAPVTEYTSDAFQNFVKYVELQGLEITVPSAGDRFALGSAEVEVLGPQRAYENVNNTSIVLRLTYGETSFLFTGDAERDSEQDMLEAGCILESTLLKVGHHGSNTSTSYEFLREVNPEYAVIMVGAGNTYGHPTDEVLSRLRDADVIVYRTDLHGDVVCYSDGKNLTFVTSRGTAPSALPDLEPSPGTYIGNLSSKKFHLPTCSGLPAEHNRIYFSSRKEAVDAGYTPCGICKP